MRNRGDKGRERKREDRDGKISEIERHGDVHMEGGESGRERMRERGR